MLQLHMIRYMVSLEQGSLRCDVNVSVNKHEEPWGTRCEIKNLNSVKNTMVAISTPDLFARCSLPNYPQHPKYSAIYHS